MSASLLLPNPCLLGIVFCISTHDGNQLVFHYPPNPNEYGFKPTPLDNQVLDNNNDNLSTSSSSESDDNDLERMESASDMEGSDRNTRGSFSTDSGYSMFHQSGSGSNRGSFEAKYASGRDILEIMDERDRRRKRKATRRLQKLNTDFTTNAKDIHSPSILSSISNGNSLITSPKVDVPTHTNEYKIEKLFTFDIDFISDLATPPKALCNNRFEVTVEDMVFLGLPIRVSDDGNWRANNKKKTTRKSVSTRNRSSRRQSAKSDDIKKVRTHETNEEDADDDADENDSGSEMQKNETDCSMYQFNLVFVMNPPVVEYNHRIDEMFHYIVSRLSLLLRYEQQNSNYIWEESQKIMKLKEELIHLPITTQWEQIIEKTSLGKLIFQTYESISKSQILNVEVNGRMRSFQIPVKTVFSTLPPRTLEIPNGSTLSSLSPFNQLNSIESTAHLDMNDDTMGHFALILLDDVESIIRDIRVDKDSVFASFIRMIKPGESLLKLSVLSGLGIQEVKLFANHLVYWRRAKAILPVSSRNTYIVSPMAPIKKIYDDSVRFNRHFPNLPSISTFLSMVSDISNSKPKPISVLIPSRDHRDLYLDAITWLLKYGYLVQLCSFFYLKITKKIKIEVDEEIEMEVKKRQEIALKSGRQNHASDDHNTTEYDSDDSLRSINSSADGDANDNTSMGHIVNKSSTNNSTDISNGNAEGTTSKVMNTDNTAEVPIAESVPESVDTKTNSGIVEFEEEEEEDSIMVEPEYATALERRWIAKVVANKPPEVVALFYRLLKHMNGKKAFEIFLIEENIARQDMRRLLEAVDENLVVVRHW